MHPDPFGITLKAVRKYLNDQGFSSGRDEGLQDGAVLGPQECAVFIDFCCLMQKDAEGNRTDEQGALFQKGLNVMSSLYASLVCTTVLTQCHVPKHLGDLPATSKMGGWHLVRLRYLRFGAATTRCKVLLQTILERKRRSKIEPPDVLDLSKRFSGIGESDPSEALDQLHGESNHPEALEQLQRVWRVWLLSPALQQHIRDGTVTEDMMNVAIDLYDKAVDLYRYDKAINPGGEDWTGGISASPTRRVSLLWNRTPYAERGWCTFERGCASMVVTHIESAIKLKETDADASSNPESSIPKVLRSAEGSRDKLVDITWAGDHTSLRSEESVTKLRALSRPVKDLRAIARAIEESKFTNEADKTAVAQMLFGLEWMMHEAMENVLLRMAARCAPRSIPVTVRLGLLACPGITAPALGERGSGSGACSVVWAGSRCTVS